MYSHRTNLGFTWIHRYSLDYTNQSGQEVVIQDNPFFRQVTTDGSTEVTWRLESLWAAGTALCLSWQVLSYLSFRRRVNRWSVPAKQEDHEEFEAQKLALGIRAHITLVRCEAVPSPLMMGFGKPTILLPAQMTEDALAATLAHELMHFKRRDLWYKLLMVFVRCVHWFNPLVWLMTRQAARDVELCCDYDLLKDQSEDARRSYGQAILNQMTSGRRSSPLTTGFSGDKKSIFTRFHAIMDTAPKKKGAIAIVAALIVVSLSGGLVAFHSAPARPNDEESTGTFDLMLDDLTDHIQVTPVGSWGQLTEFQVNIGDELLWATVPCEESTPQAGTHGIVLEAEPYIGPNESGSGLYLQSSFYPPGVSFDCQELGWLSVALTVDPETGTARPDLSALYVQLTAPISFPEHQV